MTDTTTEIHVPVSPGELIDKITILHIKSERIEDTEKNKNVCIERDVLSAAWQASEFSRTDISTEQAQLKSVNEDLWDIEDKIRIKESKKEFDQHFIELARSVYITNDKRAEIKKTINVKLGSLLVEEKSYQKY